MDPSSIPEALKKWLHARKWKLQPFQKEVMGHYLSGRSGLLNAPTGSGKTYALWLPILVREIARQAESAGAPAEGLKVIWVTPLRALARDLQRNMQAACAGLGMSWNVGVRTGDISAAERNRQKKQLPDALIITPESLHLLFTQKDSARIFKNVHTVIIDEWHELLGSKRGVQVELALAALRQRHDTLCVWGVSATIGNLEEALTLLVGSQGSGDAALVTYSGRKPMQIKTLLPEHLETLPWAGYLGIRLLDKVVEVVRKSRSTLIFTNTRSQTEIWYQALIEQYPEFAGIAALHHGSLDRELRNWVEQALHDEQLKCVICTSSLDLGVDFEPVETVIQVGSPKSIARFVQRAGRSGHQPGGVSKMYFVPTNALELIEAVSLREGVRNGFLENRDPVFLAYDVLAQWMVTRAIGEGFTSEGLYREVCSTTCFAELTREDWTWLLGYITTGTDSLQAYDEFKKVEVEGGRYVVKERRIATRHKLSMGTIVSDASLRVKFQQGKYLGSIEESFIARLKPGDIFWFAGRSVRFLRLREMTVTVKLDKSGKGIVPQWMGGRMSLSSNLSAYIRARLATALEDPHQEEELRKLMPLLALQEKRSAIPRGNQLLVESYRAREGQHLFFYPFEGRQVHEGMAALIAWRIGQVFPITFSLAMNDYGFELLSDQEFDFNIIRKEVPLFSPENLEEDIFKSLNATEMARRKFREIASIAGLVFQGYPGKMVKTQQLQSSSGLFFDVMYEYEKDNLFIRQAFQEVLEDQLDEGRLSEALHRMSGQEVVYREMQKPSPLAFPILVDRLREQLSSEKLRSRVEKMIAAYSDED